MEFRTEVKIAQHKIIDESTPFLLLGSCFSENIGIKLKDLKQDVVINPFGILYQPLAICTALHRIIDLQYYTESELIYHEGLYHSFDHHGEFSDAKVQVVLTKINQAIDDAHAQLKKDKLILLITWGTSKGYHHNTHKKQVANCHKIPATQFTEKTEEVNEIVQQWETLMNKLKAFNSSLSWVFSISPIRHKRDGFVANQINKSTLFVALNKLGKSCPFSYFPAYEIMHDELRDYRFYTEDMLHPTPQAVNYIWQKFQFVYLKESVSNYYKKIDALRQKMSHRPLHPHRAEYKRFLESILLEIENLQHLYPHVDYARELVQIQTKIDNFETHE